MANSSFFGSIGSLFKKTSDSVLGIDIGASAIKIVQLRKKGAKAELETYGELALGPYAGTEIGRATNLPTEKIVEALHDVMKEAGVTAKRCGFAIPAVSSLLSFIKMPALDNKQLAMMIPIEARKYIPVPISEVQLDWSLVPKSEGDEVSDFETAPPTAATPKGIGTVDILLAVIHKDVIERYKQIVRSVALESSFFEIEIFSSIRSVIERTLESVMIFDMGSSTTKLYVIERGNLRLTYTINRGSQDLTLALSHALGVSVGEAEHIKRTTGLLTEGAQKDVKDILALNLDYVFTEANRVILNYEKKHKRGIARIVLVGGGSILKGFLDLARTKFQTEVVLGDPFRKTEAPAFFEQVLKDAGPEFAVAIGLALKQLQNS